MNRNIYIWYANGLGWPAPTPRGFNPQVENCCSGELKIPGSWCYQLVRAFWLSYPTAQGKRAHQREGLAVFVQLQWVTPHSFLQYALKIMARIYWEEPLCLLLREWPISMAISWGRIWERTKSYYISQLVLAQPPKSWDYGCAPPQPENGGPWTETGSSVSRAVRHSSHWCWLVKPFFLLQATVTKHRLRFNVP